MPVVDGTILDESIGRRVNRLLRPSAKKDPEEEAMGTGRAGSPDSRESGYEATGADNHDLSQA